MNMIKKITILSTFFIGSYIQAESMQIKTDQENTAFFSISTGGEVVPANDFKYRFTTVDIKFGREVSQHSSFAAGLTVPTSEIQHSFLVFQYAYSFIKDSQWIPGIDISLLIGFQNEGDGPPRFELFGGARDAYFLAGGFELGPYLKTFISKTYALFLRAGVSYDQNVVDDFDLTDSRIYLNLGIQRYF